MRAELDQLHKMGTWELVDPPEGRAPIPNKWVLTKKYDKEGNLLKYKARLVLDINIVVVYLLHYISVKRTTVDIHQ